jgi:putative membrane protein
MDIFLQLVSGFPAFISHLGASLLLLALFLAIYVQITPYQEIQLIREGNMAAAISLTGAMIGFVIPLSKAVAQSADMFDMLTWAGIALIVQLLVYVVVRLIIPGISKDIPDGKVAQGTFLGALSLATGLLNSACMTY